MNDAKISESLILKKVKVGEFDIFFTALTKKYGKINIFAKSTRKIKAKLGFHLEPGSISRLYFVPKRNGSYLLTGAVSIWKPDFLKFSSFKNKIFFQALDLIDKLAIEDIQELNQILSLFDLSKKYLQSITVKKLGREKLILYQTSFILKLLDSAGFRPDFKKCANCKKIFNDKKNIYFNNESGELVCCQFSLSSISSQKINFNSLKLANYLLQEPLIKIKKLKIKKEIIEKTWKLTLNHLKYYLD
jgi:DNA repair protein RecO (recombination protein O)